MRTNTTDLKTQCLVLRRTNYGEADRILNLLTPTGKLSVLARGVRKIKSKLAGGIELFCLSEVTIHQGKTELGILTSAKMLQSYTNIMSDLSILELATSLLKRTSRAAEQVDSPEYFNLLVQIFTGLNNRLDPKLVELWANFQLAKLSGEEINLYRSADGDKLDANSTYRWDFATQSLIPDPKGDIAAREIKFARLLVASSLSTVARVENYRPLLDHLTIIFLN